MRAAVAAQAAALAQRDVQLQQLEAVKARIRADRCSSSPAGVLHSAAGT